MNNLEQVRESLVAARLALLDAELYVSVQDGARATMHMDLAQAYTVEARKQLAAPQRKISVDHQTGHPVIDRFLE